MPGEIDVVTTTRRAYASALQTSRSRGQATYVLTRASWSRSCASWWSPTTSSAVRNRPAERAGCGQWWRKPPRNRRNSPPSGGSGSAGGGGSVRRRATGCS